MLATPADERNSCVLPATDGWCNSQSEISVDGGKAHALVEDACINAAGIGSVAECAQGIPEDCSVGHSPAHYTTVLYLGKEGSAEIKAFLELNPSWKRFYFSSETYELFGMSETEAIYEDKGSLKSAH